MYTSKKYADRRADHQTSSVSRSALLVVESCPIFFVRTFLLLEVLHLVSFFSALQRFGLPLFDLLVNTIFSLASLTFFFLRERDFHCFSFLVQMSVPPVNFDFSFMSQKCMKTSLEVLLSTSFCFSLFLWAAHECSVSSILEYRCSSLIRTSIRYVFLSLLHPSLLCSCCSLHRVNHVVG